MRSAIRMSVLAGLASVGLLVPGARADEPAIAGLVGTYRNVQADGGASTIEAATDEGLEEARPLVRSMARPRILENNPPVRRLRIELEGEEVRVTYEGERSYRAPLGGEAVEQRAPDGGKVRVRYAMEGDSLVEYAVARQGSGVIRYTRRGDGLVVETLLESSRLPGPIRFAMRFTPEG